MLSRAKQRTRHQIRQQALASSRTITNVCYSMTPNRSISSPRRIRRLAPGLTLLQTSKHLSRSDWVIRIHLHNPTLHQLCLERLHPKRQSPMQPLPQLALRCGTVDQPNILHNPRTRQAPLRQLLRLLSLRMNLLRLLLSRTPPGKMKGKMKPPHSRGLLPTPCLLYLRFQSPWMPHAWQARVHTGSFSHSHTSVHAVYFRPLPLRHDTRSRPAPFSIQLFSFKISNPLSHPSPIYQKLKSNASSFAGRADRSQRSGGC